MAKKKFIVVYDGTMTNIQAVDEHMVLDGDEVFDNFTEAKKAAIRFVTSLRLTGEVQDAEIVDDE